MKNLVPAFLRRLDKYLLLHQSEIWMSRIHYVAFYCLLSFIGVFGFTYLLDVQKNDVPTYEMAWAFLSLPLLVGLVIWIRKVVQYNPVREFAKTNLLAEYKVLFSLFLGFLMFLLIPFASTSAGKLKVNTVISDAEYTADSLAFERVKFLFENNVTITEEGDEYVIIRGNNRNYSFFEERLPKNKKVLIHYLSEFKRVYSEYFIKKYTSYDYFKERNVETIYNEIFVQKNASNIRIWDAERGLNIVRNYKTFKVFPFKLIIMVIGFASLFSLLIYSFKNSRRKDFLFAIIGLVLLPEVMAFVGFLMALLSGFFVDKDVVFFFCTLIPYVVLFILVLQGLNVSSYKKKYGVAFIMFHLLSLGFPLIVLAWYDGQYGVTVSDSSYQFTILLSVIGMLVLTPLVFKPMYKKLYALPEY